MLYSKTSQGFHDSQYDKNIPEDAVEITHEEWQALLKAQSEGQIIQSDKKGYPKAVNPPAPTKEKLMEQYKAITQINCDKLAKEWGYDSLAEATSYTNSTVPQYKAEAEALIIWRDLVWVKVEEIEKEKIPKTMDDFLALLPSAPTKPTA